MNKRFVIGVCLTLNSMIGYSQAILSIEDFLIKPGETKTVTIDMSNSVEIRALQVLVNLPEHVRLVARPKMVEERQGKTINRFGRSIGVQKTLSYKVRKSGNCMIVVNASDAVPFSDSEGALIALTLKADEDATEGRVSIGLKDVELVYADGFTYVRPSDYACQVDICKNAMSISSLEKNMKGAVDVYSLEGIQVKSGVLVSELEQELPIGLYMIEGMKVYVNKRR